jgi:hypothetical protein
MGVDCVSSWGTSLAANLLLPNKRKVKGCKFLSEGELESKGIQSDGEKLGE